MTTDAGTSAEAAAEDVASTETGSPTETASPARTAPGVQLPPAAHAAFRDVRALLRARADETPLDQVLDRMREAAGAPASIVVVGEVGRGKSSVVNALLGLPGLSPVGVGETTGGYLRVVGPSPELPAGRAEVELAESHRHVDAAELADWLVIGARGADQAPALGATVAVEEPFGGAVLIDTPGAGGLDPAHARLAISQAEGAGILLLVTDTTAPLTTPALAFLDECARRVAGVVVVVNKIDMTRAWRERVAEVRETLRAHGYDGVPVVGYSALNATAALTAPEESVRARALRAANHDELTGALHGCLSRADVLPAVAALRSARALVTPVASRLVRDRLAAGGEPQVQAELAARTERLEALQDAKTSYTYDWDATTSMLRRELEEEIDQRVEEFAQRWMTRLADHRWGLSTTRSATLSVDVLADLAVLEQDVLEHFSRRFGETITALYASVGLEPGPELFLGLQSAQRPSSTSASLLADQPGDLGMHTVMPAFMGYTLGMRIAGGLGIGGATGGAALSMMGGVGAVAMIGAGLHLQSMQRRKTALMTFVRERRGTLTRRLTRAYQAGFDTVRSTVRKDFDRRLAQELRTVREQHAAAKRAAATDAEQRADAIRQVDHDLAAVEAVLQRVDGAITALLT